MNTVNHPRRHSGPNRFKLIMLATAIVFAVLLVAYSLTWKPEQPQTIRTIGAIAPQQATAPLTPAQIVARADEHGDDPDIQYQAGKTLLDAGELQRARVYLERAIELNPAYANAHNSLGALFTRLGNHEEAKVSYLRAIAIDPDLAEAHYNLGTSAAALGDHETAIEEFTITLSLDPTFTRAYNNLGGIYTRESRFDEAIDQFKAALTVDPAFTNAHRNLASVYDHLGDTEQAAYHRQQADITD